MKEVVKVSLKGVCKGCTATERFWNEIKDKYPNIQIRTVYHDTEEGRSLCVDNGVRGVPAFFYRGDDGIQIMYVGSDRDNFKEFLRAVRRG